MTVDRISLDQYFMEIAALVAKRSTCIRRHVGAVLVKEGQILSTGYNGAPAGIPHCDQTTCVRLAVESGQSLEECYAVHAEANCIIQAALHGTSIAGDTTLYCTTFPCISCLKLLMNARIKRIVFADGYDLGNPVKQRLIRESGISIEHYQPS
jgi:dCMP deaminase